jgi:hypothetical protein
MISAIVPSGLCRFERRRPRYRARTGSASVIGAKTNSAPTGQEEAMADSIRKLDYFAASVANKRGEGARVLQALGAEGVNLVAFTGFPSGGGKAQLDFVPENAASFVAAAARIKLKLRAPKSVFVIQGDDRPGAIASLAKRLADAKIGITAIDAASAGNGRYSAMLWVKAKDVEQAARVLGAV